MFDDAALQVNIAVIGNSGAGKSTLIRKTLDLSEDEMDNTRTVSVMQVVCAVEMIEMSIANVYNQEEDSLTWPNKLGAKQIHGAITLYDVGSKASYKHVPEVLSQWILAIPPNRARVLTSCRCHQ